MANFVFVDYDSQTGRYLGHTYAPDRNPASDISFRKLTIEEARIIGSEYREYRYNEPQLVKLPELHFVVSPNSTYQIGQHDKICISLRRSIDTPDSEYEQLKNNQYKIRINDQEIMLKFEDMLFINPTQSGMYIFELIDQRVYAEKTTYVVSVLEPTPQQI